MTNHIKKSKSEIDKAALKKRCELILNTNGARKRRRFASKFIFESLVKIGLREIAPFIHKKPLKAGAKRRRGKYLNKVFMVYLDFLIEESLKYPIDIYIPKVGILNIRETSAIGKKYLWMENGVYNYRLDTVFDKSVYYRIYHHIFGLENLSYKTPFKLRRRFVKPILYKIYQKHPEGNYYRTLIKNKK